MCFEYYERMERLEQQRRRGLLDQHQDQTQTRKDRESATLERLDWPTPEEPARTLDEKVPA